MQTSELIDRLARDARPVRRLRPPLWRTALWLAAALPATAAVVAIMGLRPDLPAELDDPLFLLRLAGAFGTAMAAGWAALAAGVPGMPRWKLLIPIAPAAIWLATLGRQCWLGWPETGLGPAWESDCVFAIAAVSVAPTAVIFALIRRGARLGAGPALAWAAVAVAALADVGLRAFHGHDAALMDVAWQLACAAALAIAGRFGLPAR